MFGSKGVKKSWIKLSNTFKKRELFIKESWMQKPELKVTGKSQSPALVRAPAAQYNLDAKETWSPGKQEFSLLTSLGEGSSERILK